MHRLAAVLPVALVGCTEPPPPSPSGCDPVDPHLCALPFPSSAFLAEDPETETGYRVAFPDTAFPENLDGVPLTPTAWNRRDGFSIATPLLVQFDDVALDGVIGLDDLDAFQAPDALTVIVDAETGERVPHFVELDRTAPTDAERLLMLRPVEALRWGRRYVVGIRGLVRTDGAPVDVSPAFAALRDGTDTDDPDVILRRAHYDDAIFPVLEDQGFLREELQIAWDFVTASRQSTLGDLLWVREDVLAWLDGNEIAYVIDAVEDGTCAPGEKPHGRRVEGRITNMPLYLARDAPGEQLARDGADRPMRNGTKEVGFSIRIPCSVRNDPRPTKLVQYGHGFFGDRSEVNTGWLAGFLDDRGYVAIASDWTGMSQADAAWIALAIAQDVSTFSKLPEGAFQGFVEAMAVLRLATGPLVDDPALAFDTPDGPVGVIDPDDVVYYGISQGGILGGAYVGLSPDLERAAFGVTGGPYGFLTHRSNNFDPFFDLFKAKYGDHRHITLLIGALQGLWDPGDPLGWGYDLVDPVDPHIPPKTVLIQNAIGDYQVSTYGGHIQARQYGAVQLAPQTREIFGIPEVEGPVTEGAVLVEWAYTDVPEEPLENVPPLDEGRDPHECPRRNPDGQDQVAHFFDTGEIRHFCDGPCIDVQAETCP